MGLLKKKKNDILRLKLFVSTFFFTRTNDVNSSEFDQKKCTFLLLIHSDTIREKNFFGILPKHRYTF